MATMTKLEPCPFCGDAPKVQMVDDPSEAVMVYAVECPCGVRGPGRFWEVEAVALWNRRRAHMMSLKS